jgi:hypothetical protein
MLIMSSVRYQVTGANTVDFNTEAHKLAELIQQYNLE